MIQRDNMNAVDLSDGLQALCRAPLDTERWNAKMIGYARLTGQFHAYVRVESLGRNGPALPLKSNMP
jgi:hypothetical protein